MYENSYKTARFLLRLLELVGWLLSVVSVVAVIAVFNDDSPRSLMIARFIIPGGLAGILLGLILVAMTQVSTAVLDQADISREMLRKMKAAGTAS